MLFWTRELDDANATIQARLKDFTNWTGAACPAQISRVLVQEAMGQEDHSPAPLVRDPGRPARQVTHEQAREAKAINSTGMHMRKAFRVAQRSGLAVPHEARSAGWQASGNNPF
jgi:hypothetical protein